MNFYILIIVLVFIIINDIKNRTITNRSLLLLFGVVVQIIINQQYDTWFYSLLILAIGFGLSLLNIIGGGDVKLLAILALAIKPEFLTLCLFLTVVLGGVVALGYLAYGKLTDMERVRRRGIPYALPICLGCSLGLFMSS